MVRTKRKASSGHAAPHPHANHAAAQHAHAHPHGGHGHHSGSPGLYSRSQAMPSTSSDLVAPSEVPAGLSSGDGSVRSVHGLNRRIVIGSLFVVIMAVVALGLYFLIPTITGSMQSGTDGTNSCDPASSESGSAEASEDPGSSSGTSDPLSTRDSRVEFMDAVQQKIAQTSLMSMQTTIGITAAATVLLLGFNQLFHATGKTRWFRALAQFLLNGFSMLSILILVLFAIACYTTSASFAYNMFRFLFIALVVIVTGSAVEFLLNAFSFGFKRSSAGNEMSRNYMLTSLMMFLASLAAFGFLYMATNDPLHILSSSLRNKFGNYDSGRLAVTFTFISVGLLLEASVALVGICIRTKWIGMSLFAAAIDTILIGGACVYLYRGIARESQTISSSDSASESDTASTEASGSADPADNTGLVGYVVPNNRVLLQSIGIALFFVGVVEFGIAVVYSVRKAQKRNKRPEETRDRVIETINLHDFNKKLGVLVEATNGMITDREHIQSLEVQLRDGIKDAEDLQAALDLINEKFNKGGGSFAEFMQDLKRLIDSKDFGDGVKDKIVVRSRS